MKKDQRIQAQFTVKMLAWLKEESERRDCSIAQILRTLVLAEMNRAKK
jgi:hypothetical protein